MLAAILICGAMTVLTSCSENDNPVDSKTLAEKLVGEWIMEHDMDGVDLFVEGNDVQIPADADMFTNIYHFDADGKGWTELVIMKDGKCVASVTSRYGEGEFTYTIDKNGKVLVNYPKEEIGDELTFDGQRLTTLVRGQQFSFVRATKEQIEKYKAEADAFHGGSDEPRITKTIRYEEKKATVYNFEYPSTDPFGNPVTLSGSIILGDETTFPEQNIMEVSGIVLYNHFTVFHQDECPSHGDLDVPMIVVGSEMAVVAPDYYGFGVTGDKNQAYCISRANAQASVDALIAARELIKGMGYKLGDYLFNVGYSQGGQTAIGVLRLLAEKYPDIKVTHTIAGGGPYDIGETYRQLVSRGESTMPSTVISSVLSYNEYFNLGVDYADVFKEDVLKRIPEYLLSKKYKRDELEGKLASNKLSEVFLPAMFDFESPLSKKFMEAFEKDNLCKGWTPRKTERITLVHNELDGCVPYANATKMADFFEKQGFKVDRTTTDDRYVDGKVFLCNFSVPDGVISPKLGAHEAGALQFAIEFMNTACHYLEPFDGWWWKPSAKEIEDFLGMDEK